MCVLSLLLFLGRVKCVFCGVGGGRVLFHFAFFLVVCNVDNVRCYRVLCV